MSDRGYFMGTYNRRDTEKVGSNMNLVANLSANGALKGLHFQKRYPQCKPVRVIKRCVFVVAVDIRKGSKYTINGSTLSLRIKTKNSFT